MVDARAAQRAGCKFRKTGNLVWLTSQPIPNRAILRYEAWDDLPPADQQLQQPSESRWGPLGAEARVVGEPGRPHEAGRDHAGRGGGS